MTRFRRYDPPMRMTKPAAVASLCLVSLAIAAGIAWRVTGDERLLLACFMIALACIVLPLLAMDVYVWKLKAKLMRTLFSKEEFARLAETTPVRTLDEYKSLGFRIASIALAFGIAFLFASVAVVHSLPLFVGGVGAVLYGLGGLLAARTFTADDIDPAKTKKRMEYLRYVLIAGMVLVAWIVYEERDVAALTLLLPLAGFGTLLYGLWRTVMHAFRH